MTLIEPNFTTRGEFHIIGRAERTTNLLESDPMTARIPAAWETFIQDDLTAFIPHQINPGILLAIYTEYEGDHAGEYTHIIGAEVSRLSDIPAGMVGLTVAPAHYTVFRAVGEMPDAVFQAWQAVWDYFAQPSVYQRAYTADYEHYGDTTGVSIYVAVR